MDSPDSSGSEGEPWPENHPVLQGARRRAREAEAAFADRYPEAGEALIHLRDLLDDQTGDEFDIVGVQARFLCGSPLVTMGFLGDDAVRALTILARHWTDEEV